MADLTVLFKVGQKVKVKCNEEWEKTRFLRGEVKETHKDHILVYIPELDITNWYEEGWNLGKVYPEYNFCF